MHETMTMHGRLILQVTGRDGGVLAVQRVPNRIVTSGRRLVAELFGGVAGGTPPSKVTHMAIGTSPSDATDNQVGLGTERTRAPITGVGFREFPETVGGVTTQRVVATLTAVFDFDQANDSAVPLREAGIFTAAAGGVMYNRVVFAPVTKTNAFQLTMLWDVTF
jgi:hypothetical protein